MLVPKIFISYNHRDARALKRLMTFLKPHQREGKLDVWADMRLVAGENWSNEIEKKLAVATVAVLLISQEFLESDFINSAEIPAILRREALGELRIIPFYLSKSTAAEAEYSVTHPRTRAKTIVKLTNFQAGGGTAPDKPISDSGRPIYKSKKWQSAFKTLADELISLSGTVSSVNSVSSVPSVYELLGCASEKLKLMLLSEASAHTEFFQKYVWQVYSERQGANESFNAFLKIEDPERCCFVVVGKAGKGKTSLLCHLASRLSDNSPVGIYIPVLLSSSELKLGEESLHAAIVERLIGRPRQYDKEQARSDLIKLAAAITAEKGALVIFLDALNELEGTHPFRHFNDQFDELVRDCRALGLRLIFCMSCRSEIWHNFTGTNWAQQHIFGATRSGQPSLEIDDFDEQYIDSISQRYFKWYAIEAQLLGSARRSCCDPLMLRYLCAAYTRRPPNDKTTPPQEIPKYKLGHVQTLRRKEAFDTFVENRRQSMFKVVQRALDHADDRSLYSFTTLYLMTMAYEMFQKRRSFLWIQEVIEIAWALDHPDWRLAEKGGKEFFQSKPESVFYMLVDEGVILNKRDQGSISFTFEAYFEYSLGRYFAHERWPRKLATGATEDEIVDDFKDLLRQHRELSKDTFHNLFGACHFAVLELEQGGKEAGSSARLIESLPTLFIHLVEAMAHASEEGLDWIQQALSTIRETAIVQPEIWQNQSERKYLLINVLRP